MTDLFKLRFDLSVILENIILNINQKRDYNNYIYQYLFRCF